MTTNVRTNLVDEHFHEASPYWKDVYSQDTLYGALYRERRRSVLGFVDGLGLPMGAQALEVGCGAGSTSIALAQRGLQVNAVDKVPAMVELTRQAVRDERLSDRVSASVGDVHELEFADASFDLVLAIGVMEWMPSYTQPLSELYRVLRPGGHLVVNVDNAWAVHCLLDPRMSPAAGSLKRFARLSAEKLGFLKPLARPTRCSRRRFDRAVSFAGFEKLAEHTGGFGPMTMLGLKLFSDHAGVKLHHKLQDLADRGTAMIRHGGETYLVLAKKPLGGAR